MRQTVLLLHRGGDSMRGTEACVIETARALAACGKRVVIARNVPVMDAQLETIEPRPKVLSMDFPELKLEGKDTTLPLVAYGRASRRLHRLVRELNPALIYCSGGLPCQLAVPVARMHRVPVLCHFHHPTAKRDYYVWLVKGATKVIFPSQYTRLHSLKKARVDGEVIYNGIDTTRFAPAATADPSWRKQLQIAEDAVVIGQVGALVSHKRADLLIRAFAAVRGRCEVPLHLCLVGAGDEESPMRALIHELGLQGCATITGFVPDVLPYYQHVFDINVLVSRVEGLGIAAIEGSACGLPLVATDCSGLSETVVAGVTGFTFGLDDSVALEEQLLRLARDPVLRARIGAAGRVFARETFPATAYQEKIVAVVQKLMRS